MDIDNRDSADDCMKFTPKDQETIRKILCCCCQHSDAKLMDIARARELCDDYKQVQLFLVDIMGFTKNFNGNYLMFNPVK